MKRVPDINRQQLSAAEKQIWDVIDKTRGGVWGPYAVLMSVPALAEKVAAVGEQLRFHGTLPDYERELVTLTTAKEAGSLFEWSIHRPLAEKAGVAKDIIDILECGGSLDHLNRRDKLIIDIVRSLFRTRKLSDKMFAQAVDEFGQNGLVELIAIVGFYEMLALILLAFEVSQGK